MNVSNRSRLAALLLNLLCGALLFGLHRFYVGKIWTGLLWLITGGLLGIGQLIDLVLIIIGAFKDKEGRPLVRW